MFVSSPGADAYDRLELMEGKREILTNTTKRVEACKNAVRMLSEKVFGLLIGLAKTDAFAVVVNFLTQGCGELNFNKISQEQKNRINRTEK